MPHTPEADAKWDEERGNSTSSTQGRDEKFALPLQFGGWVRLRDWVQESGSQTGFLELTQVGQGRSQTGGFCLCWGRHVERQNGEDPNVHCRDRRGGYPLLATKTL